MTDKDKRLLQSSLKLLGFDDGAEDILEHLLTIDSKADLSEYLVQLLGGKGQCLDDFVDNVGRFQNGEALVIEGLSGGGNEANAKEEAKPPAKEIKSKSPSQPKNETLRARRNKQQQDKKSRIQPAKSTNRKSPPPPSGTASNHANNQQQQVSRQSARNPSPTSAKATKPSPERAVPKSHPKKGQATKVCGCFGTRHKALTNCLYCGRISCEVEGYDFCPYCGLMVEEITGGNGVNDKAWIQKERLLRFDREFARRTEIFDDQADYQHHTAWMTEDEAAEAADKEEKRLQSLRRPKQTMNLAI